MYGRAGFRAVCYEHGSLTRHDPSDAGGPLAPGLNVDHQDRGRAGIDASRLTTYPRFCPCGRIRKADGALGRAASTTALDTTSSEGAERRMGFGKEGCMHEGDVLLSRYYR